MATSEQSLFSRLKGLFPSSGFPLEDYLTELVAHVVSRHPKEFIGWLRELGLTKLNQDAFLSVQTQYHCAADALAETPDKYPDIVLHLSDQTKSEIIFIESKVGSDLSGADQLQRYAQILSGKDADRRTLLFITRDYSPQNRDEVLSLVPSGQPLPEFRQKRWYDFAAYWSRPNCPAASDPLSADLIRFMKEQNLTKETQLTPQALAALGGFHEAFNVLRAVLDDELRARVKEISGTVRDDYDTSVAVVREQAFLLRSSRQQNLSIGVGFWLPPGEDGYPHIYGEVAFEGKCEGKKEILAALQEIARKKPQSWSADNLSDVAPWGRIFRESSLAAFLGETNHVAALKKFLNSVLDDIAEFRRTYPKLRW